MTTPPQPTPPSQEPEWAERIIVLQALCGEASFAVQEIKTEAAKELAERLINESRMHLPIPHPSPDASSVKALCETWAEDHTYLQTLCRKAGCSEYEVEGDSYGVPGIMELADLLFARIIPSPEPFEEQDFDRTHLSAEGVPHDFSSEPPARLRSASSPATTPPPPPAREDGFDAAWAACLCMETASMKEDARIVWLAARESAHPPVAQGEEKVESMYQKCVRVALCCDPIPASKRPDNRLEPPWEVFSRLHLERNVLRENLAVADDGLERKIAIIKGLHQEQNELRDQVATLRQQLAGKEGA